MRSTRRLALIAALSAVALCISAAISLKLYEKREL